MTTSGNKHTVINLVDHNIQVQADGGSFTTRFANIFSKYAMPQINGEAQAKAWYADQLTFWQAQLNSAVWFATTGCGITKAHLDHPLPMLRSLFRFHTYYQIRKMLAEMSVPLPADSAWNAFNNPINRRAYEGICAEFMVSPSTSWALGYRAGGLGEAYAYATGDGYFRVDDEYAPGSMKFGADVDAYTWHIDFVKQDAPDVGTAWTTLIADEAPGYTRPGYERLNDSIRTYVWAIIGSQAQTRTEIISSASTAFDAQKQFLSNVEDSIVAPPNLVESVGRYQDILGNARSEVNFVFAPGLYMASSDMLLRVGKVAGYNNLIIIATADMPAGVNRGLNSPKPLPPLMDAPAAENPPAPQVPPKPAAAPQVPPKPAASAPTEDEEAKALVVAMAIAGAGFLAFMLW